MRTLSLGRGGSAFPAAIGFAVNPAGRGADASCLRALIYPHNHLTAYRIINTLNVGVLSGLTGPYAQVSITRVDDFTANIVFTSLMTNGVTFLMGDGGTADLNVTGPYSLGTVTGVGLPGFTPIFIGNSPGQVHGFGVFNLSLDNFDGYGDAANSVSFQITNTTGL
jgi:hypothetical protein